MEAAPDVPVPLPAGIAILSPDESGRMAASELAKTGDKQLLKALELLEAQLK